MQVSGGNQQESRTGKPGEKIAESETFRDRIRLKIRMCRSRSRAAAPSGIGLLKVLSFARSRRSFRGGEENAEPGVEYRGGGETFGYDVGLCGRQHPRAPQRCP